MASKARTMPSKTFSSGALTKTNEKLLKAKKEKEDPKDFDKQIQEKFVFCQNRLSFDGSNVEYLPYSSKMIHSSSLHFSKLQEYEAELERLRAQHKAALQAQEDAGLQATNFKSPLIVLLSNGSTLKQNKEASPEAETQVESCLQHISSEIFFKNRVQFLKIVQLMLGHMMLFLGHVNGYLRQAQRNLMLHVSPKPKPLLRVR